MGTMNQLESTQRKVTGMIGVAENIFCKERLKERRKPTKQQQQTKTMHKSHFQILKINCKVEDWSVSIVDTTRRNNFTLEQRLILFLVGAAIFKHWERYFTEDVETLLEGVLKQLDRCRK